MSINELSQPIRKYIRDKGWESLRPIQAAAIEKILAGNGNYILSSRTASGKTEAAFLPILSKIDFREKGVQVLYISPLIALINDQFFRVEELCKYLEVKVTKWHGEASKSEKDHLVQSPEGIVLITPESLEAMFVNAPFKVKALFSNLKYLIIDEIHSFIGTDRGVQLKSIISRIEQVKGGQVSIIGLSATIGNWTEAKKMTGDEVGTKVLIDRATKDMDTEFRYFPCEPQELSLDLLKDLYLHVYAHKVLIFPNSRGRAEEIAVKLKRIAEKSSGHPYYFSHHSSIDKELRTYIEDFAKNNQRNNFCICCTSTLELGIDIGTVDTVVQVDATFSIASLIQRVGRSGRKDGEKSKLILYATNPWSLLQSLTCWLLYREGFIEPFVTAKKPYDILLHQMLSTVKQLSGCSKDILLDLMGKNFAFSEINRAETGEIIDELLRTDMLELVGRDLIIGLDGERTVNNKDFYSVFRTEPNFKVINGGKTLGEVPFSVMIREGENMLLAARIWKITDVDEKAGKIQVIPAADGKKPLFFGTGSAIHSQIRNRMLQILFDHTEYEILDVSSAGVLSDLRKDFSSFPLKDVDHGRPFIRKDNHIEFYSFEGTRVNRSIQFLLIRAGISCIYDESQSLFDIKTDSPDLTVAFGKMLEVIPEIDKHLEATLSESNALLEFSKWGRYLPVKFQVEILKERYFDFAASEEFLKSCVLITV